MKKILFITAILIGFLGSAQDSIVKAVSLKGRGPFLVKGSITGTTITGAQIVDSLNLELGSTDWQTGGSDDQTASEVSITDVGSYFTGTDVEAALQELGSGTSGGTTFIKKNIRIATTANITLSGLQIIDGNLTAQGERVLVKNQSTPSENGIYLASSGSWARSPEANTNQKLARTYVYVTSGNTMFDKFFLTDFDTSDTLGSDDVIFTETPFDLTGGTPTTDASALTSGTLPDARLSSNALPATVSQNDAEAGTSTSVFRWTPQRVKQAIDNLAIIPDDASPRKALIWGPGTKAEFYADYPWPSSTFPVNGIAFVTDSITPKPAMALDSLTDVTMGAASANSGGTLRVLADPNTDGTYTEVDWTPPGGGGSGTGDVTKVGTPLINQVAIWTGDGTLKGESELTYNGDVLNLMEGDGIGPIWRQQSVSGGNTLNFDQQWFNGTFRTSWSDATSSSFSHRLDFASQGLYPLDNQTNLGLAGFRFLGAYSYLFDTPGGTSTQWNDHQRSYAKTTSTTTLAQILQATIVDGDVTTSVATGDIYVYDSGATAGDVAPNDQVAGTGFWINKTKGYDPTQNVVLNNGGSISPRLGISNFYNTANQDFWLSFSNSFVYFNYQRAGDPSTSLLFAPTQFRPSTNGTMDFGSNTNRFNRGYFGGQVFGTGFNTGGTSSQFLKANGSIDSNTYLTPPSFEEAGSSASTTLTHANGTRSFTAGGSLTYTLEPNSSVAHLVGTRIMVVNEGATEVVITAGTGVTLVPIGTSTATLTAGMATWVVQSQIDEWFIININ